MRMIDPNQSGSLDYKEWLNFMQATDSDLESNEWKDALSAVKLRKKINRSLLDPVRDTRRDCPTRASPRQGIRTPRSSTGSGSRGSDQRAPQHLP